MVSKRKIADLRNRIGVGHSVAEELLILSGEDIELAEEASKASRGLDQCKAYIINTRLSELEEEVYGSED